MAFETLPATGAKIESQPTLADATVKRQVMAIGDRDGGPGDPLSEILAKLPEGPAEELTLQDVLTAVQASRDHLAALVGSSEDGAPVPTVGLSAKVPVTPTVTNGSYAANDVIGGKLTFADMARITGGSGWLQSVTIGLKTAITPVLELWLFDADPTSTTLADNAQWSLNAADLGKVCAIVKFAAADWCDGGTPNVASIEYVRKYSLTATSMYGYLVDRTGVTLTSTSDVTITPKAALD